MAKYIVEVRLSFGTNRDTYASESEARNGYNAYCRMLEQRGYRQVSENREHNARMYSNNKGDYRKVSFLTD